MPSPSEAASSKVPANQYCSENLKSSEELRLKHRFSTGNMSSSPMSPKTGEHDKRLRREIANSNERRRMQSINAGFESLKTLIPHHEGEKLSKAAILMQTTDYISNLEQEKTRLLSQNAQLKGMLRDVGRLEGSDSSSTHGSPPPKRKKRDTESSDEGISLSVAGEFDEPSLEELRREMIDLRTQLDRERRLRMLLEEQTRNLEAQLYPERLRQINNHVDSHIEVAERKRPYHDEQQQDEDMPESCLLKPSNPPTQAGNPLMSSMSRRNLETIVEAIRHLEGDAVLRDTKPDTKDCHIPLHGASDESTVEESSDQEDSRSEASGRDSPCTRMHDSAMPMIEPSAHTTLHLKHESHIISANSEKYPIAMQLLHQNSPLPKFVARQGVIIQKT